MLRKCNYEISLVTGAIHQIFSLAFLVLREAGVKTLERDDQDCRHQHRKPLVRVVFANGAIMVKLFAFVNSSLDVSRVCTYTVFGCSACVYIYHTHMNVCERVCDRMKKQLPAGGRFCHPPLLKGDTGMRNSEEYVIHTCTSRYPFSRPAMVSSNLDPDVWGNLRIFTGSRDPTKTFPLPLQPSVAHVHCRRVRYFSNYFTFVYENMR